MKKRLMWLGPALLGLAMLAAFILNLPSFGCKSISFASKYGEKTVTLKASYREVKGADYAVLICPGYSCDRQKWRPFMELFVANGYTTMSFDYSGQGASSGTIGFDNAKTDCIPEEINDAIEKLHELSGIAYDHIILVGHSMGGRSILRLLYDYNVPGADTRVTYHEIKNVILMSPEVNYNYNAQASLFAGTSDAVEYPWKNLDEKAIKGTSVYLFGSTADDIVADEDVIKIYEHLGGNTEGILPNKKLKASTELAEIGAKISIAITSGVLHSYIMYSPTFAGLVNDALTEISGTKAPYPAPMLWLVYLSWFAGLMGIFLTLRSLTKELGWNSNDSVPELTDSAAFLKRKMLLWLPGTLVAFLVCCICVVIPFGSPVMNTPYMCFIAGYGLTMLIFYRKGSFKGTTGKLPKISFKTAADKKTLLTTAGVATGLIFVVWYVMRASMYRLIPLNFRLFWVAFAAVLMAVGYYVSGCETDMLKKSKAPRKVVLLYSLIQYVPLFLLVIFYMVIGSYSGMIGQIQNMILMYIFCIPLGEYIKKRLENRVLGAVITAFLFQTLMITSAALISLF